MYYIKKLLTLFCRNIYEYEECLQVNREKVFYKKKISKMNEFINLKQESTELNKATV